MLIVIFSLKNWLHIPGKHQTKIKLQKLLQTTVQTRKEKRYCFSHVHDKKKHK